MSIPRRIEVLGLGGAKALARAQDAATSAAAAVTSATSKATEAVAAALEAKGYRDQASTIAGLPTEAAAQAYNLENDPDVKAVLSASIDAALVNVEGYDVGAAAKAQGQRLKAQLTGRQSQVMPVTLGAIRAHSSTVGSEMSTNLGAATFTAMDDTIAVSGTHGLAVGDAVSFGGVSTGPLVNGYSGTVYYVVEVPTSTTFKVSSTRGGAVLDLTNNGTTSHTFKNAPIIEKAWISGAVNPKLLVTETRPVQAGGVTPQSDFIKPDPTIITYAPGTATITAIAARTVFNGDKIDAMLFNSGAGAIRVYADGLLIDTITPAQLSAAGIGSGTTGRKLYTFADAQQRVLTQVSEGSAPIMGWARPAANSIAYPAGTDKGPRVLVVGDSFTEGTGVSAGYGYTRWLGWLLGWRDLWRSGSGSTGYYADGTRTALVDRHVNDVINQAPDICVIAMGINDRNAYSTTPAAVLDAATTIWDALIAARPATELVVVGPWSNKGGTYVDSVLVALDNDLRDLAVARGLRYVSPVAEGWITGNGRVGATTGNGNADIYISSDGTHPSDAGHEYLAWRLAGHLAVPYLPA